MNDLQPLNWVLLSTQWYMNFNTRKTNTVKIDLNIFIHIPDLFYLFHYHNVINNGWSNHNFSINLRILTVVFSVTLLQSSHFNKFTENLLLIDGKFLSMLLLPGFTIQITKGLFLLLFLCNNYIFKFLSILLKNFKIFWSHSYIFSTVIAIRETKILLI